MVLTCFFFFFNFQERHKNNEPKQPTRFSFLTLQPKVTYSNELGRGCLSQNSCTAIFGKQPSFSWKHYINFCLRMKLLIQNTINKPKFERV